MSIIIGLLCVIGLALFVVFVLSLCRAAALADEKLGYK